MPLDRSASCLPSEVLIIRGARTPAKQGYFDGWRADLKNFGINSIQAPGDDYWPHIDHKSTALEVCELLAKAEAQQLLLCHSYGGNIAFQVLRAVPELQEKVAAVVHMASPLKLQYGFLPEPTPDLEVPVIGFRGTEDTTVPFFYTGSSIDTVLHDFKASHESFVTEEVVRAKVLEVLQEQLEPATVGL